MENYDSAQVGKLLQDMIGLRNRICDEGNELFGRWEPLIRNKGFIESAKNLAYYLSLRSHDIRGIQENLIHLGLSSLGRLESRTLWNLDAVIFLLSNMVGGNAPRPKIESPDCSSFFYGKRILDQNSERIFGPPSKKRHSAIMVTLPSEAAEDQRLVSRLISHGMNVARINCAHDDEEAWSRMIDHVRAAEKKLGLSCRVLLDIAGPKARIKTLTTSLGNPVVHVGDSFLFTGSPAVRDFHGMEIVCEVNLPEIVPMLRTGDPVLVDDGTIECTVSEIVEDGVVLRVDKVSKEKGIRLKAKKGLNFPKSSADICILSDSDRKDLDFACQRADIIGFSFIRSGEDIHLIQEELQKRMGGEKASKIPIMAKIETIQGVDNLSEIIVAAASRNPVCVMIARGDLAVETGYLRLAELQEEILWICEAAHVPVIWATQVLDSMVKTGIPTRAEITDAAMGGRAECVMLNKGAFLLETLSALDDILVKMQAHQYKKTPKLRALGLAKKGLKEGTV